MTAKSKTTEPEQQGIAIDADGMIRDLAAQVANQAVEIAKLNAVIRALQNKGSAE